MVELERLQPGQVITKVSGNQPEYWTVEAAAQEHDGGPWVPIRVMWAPNCWWYDTITPENSHEFTY